MKALRYAVLAGLVASGNAFAETNYSLVEKWQNRSLSGFFVDNNFINDKESRWVLKKTNSHYNTNYYNICLAKTNAVPNRPSNICLYSSGYDLKLGSINPSWYNASWRFVGPYRWSDGIPFYKIVNRYNQKIHFENGKAEVVYDNYYTNFWWWSAMFKKTSIPEETIVKRPEEVIFDEKNYPIRSKRTRTIYKIINKDGDLTVELTGLENDIDLYVKRNGYISTGTMRNNNSPQTESNAGYCAPFEGNLINETCILRGLNKGDRVYIRLYSPKDYNGYSYVNIKGTLTEKKDEGNTAPTTDENKLDLPFDYNKIFYVCQGYHGPASHQSWTNNKYALDFTISDNEFGSSACWGNEGNGASTKTNGQPIRAPAKGIISFVGTDTLCMNIEEGFYRGYSVELGHSNNFSVKKDQEVARNQILGVIESPTPNGGIFSHYHMALFSKKDCEDGSNIPFYRSLNGKMGDVGGIIDQENFNLDKSTLNNPAATKGWRKKAFMR